MIELIRLIIELIHLLLFFIDKFKNKNKNNNNRGPQQVTVIINYYNKAIIFVMCYQSRTIIIPRKSKKSIEKTT